MVWLSAMLYNHDVDTKVRKKMIKYILVSIILLVIAMSLLGIRLILGKKNFVHTHVDGNKEMARRNIFCVKAQDLEARAPKKIQIKTKNINKK